MNKTIIEVKNLTKKFKLKRNEITAVNNISFSVNKGEVFGFLGENGAGKSTSIKIITGQLFPTEGDIKVCGISPITDEKKLSRKIGIVPELPNLYNGISLKKNLYFFAKLYDVNKKVVDEFIDKFDLKTHENKNIEKLSKGLKQKVLIARALLHNPEVIFLDEPTSGLDPNNAIELKNIIKKLKTEGKTVFLTTHNMSDADELCDRIAIMKSGNILALDTPHNLKLKYSSNKVVVETISGTAEYSFEEFGKLPTLDMSLVKTIHSSEPTLEDVFVKVTGGDL